MADKTDKTPDTSDETKELNADGAKELDELKSELNDIKESLTELTNQLQEKENNDNLSEDEKKTKTDELKAEIKVETDKLAETRQKIEKKIQSLDGKKDDYSKKEKEELEILLTTADETMALHTSILNTLTTKPVSTENAPEEEKKGFFGRTTDWVAEQWNDLKDKEKRKTETGYNLLRAGGALVTGVALYKGVKKLWNRAFGKKKKKEDGESKSSSKESESKKKDDFWDGSVGKFIKGAGAVLAVGSVGYYVAHGLYTKDWGLDDLWDREKKSTLTVKESLSVAAGEVNCGTLEENMYRQNFEGIEYNENTGIISSYGEETQINEKKKCIVGLEKVKFKSNTELVHAANIVNGLKYNLRGKGGAADAFAQTSTGGDIAFKFSNAGVREVLDGSNSKFWTKTLRTLGVIGGTVAGVASESVTVGIGGVLGFGAAGSALGSSIDNDSSLGKCCSTIKDGDNFKRFIGYLNEIKEGGESIWLPGNKELEPDNKSPIQKYINQVEEEIRDTNRTETSTGKIRNLKGEPKDSNTYTISSYGHQVDIKINGDVKNDSEGKIDPTSIQSITIEQYGNYDIGGELKLEFPNTEDGIRECIRVVNLTNKIRKEYGGMGGEEYPIFYNKRGMNGSTYGPGLWIDTKKDKNKNMPRRGVRILTNETLSNKYPTLLKDLEKSESNRTQYFKEQLEGKKNGSSYLKFLNGMRNNADQKYWTNGQKV